MIGGASIGACATDRRTLELAVEAFYAMNGDVRPPTEAELVGMFLREESTLFDIDTAGQVVAAPGGPCAI